jgi:RNA polymerase sigma factor (sigma-70 family)
MAGMTIHTTQLKHWLDRMHAGDGSAREELLRAIGPRMERLTHQMLRRFPGVARWEQADDVLNNALMRLLRALEEVQPASVRAFFGLATTQIRRELLDLARHYQGPLGLGANHVSHRKVLSGHESEAEIADPIDRPDESDDLERWVAFHEAVEMLPAEDREVIGLVFYHGWTQAKIAELFQVNERTIRRRWQSACLRLHQALGDQPRPIAVSQPSGG